MNMVETTGQFSGSMLVCGGVPTTEWDSVGLPGLQEFNFVDHVTEVHQNLNDIAGEKGGVERSLFPRYLRLYIWSSYFKYIWGLCWRHLRCFRPLLVFVEYQPRDRRSFSAGQTFQINLKNGYSASLTGWTHTRDYAGFLRNAAGKAGHI